MSVLLISTSVPSRASVGEAAESWGCTEAFAGFGAGLGSQRGWRGGSVLLWECGGPRLSPPPPLFPTTTWFLGSEKGPHCRPWDFIRSPWHLWCLCIQMERQLLQDHSPAAGSVARGQQWYHTAAATLKCIHQCAARNGRNRVCVRDPRIVPYSKELNEI